MLLALNFFKLDIEQANQASNWTNWRYFFLIFLLFFYCGVIVTGGRLLDRGFLYKFNIRGRGRALHKRRLSKSGRQLDHLWYERLSSTIIVTSTSSRVMSRESVCPLCWTMAAMISEARSRSPPKINELSMFWVVSSESSRMRGLGSAPPASFLDWWEYTYPKWTIFPRQKWPE